MGPRQAGWRVSKAAGRDRQAWRLLLLMAAFLVPRSGLGDDFESLDPVFLSNHIPGEGRKGMELLTVRELTALPEVVRDLRSPLVLVKTNEGDLAKVILAPALRRRAPSNPASAVDPVLVIERYETWRSDGSRKAMGRGVVLFDGFEFDLDTGLVVPQERGGDIRYETTGKPAPRVTALGPARLVPVTQLPATPQRQRNLSPGRDVNPGDFEGQFILHANGQKTGELELQVDKQRNVAGKFRSAADGSVYPVEGRLDAANPRKIHFAIVFPRARQAYTGWILSEGKNAIAGAMTLLEQEYGFVAIRRGSVLEPSGR